MARRLKASQLVGLRTESSRMDYRTGNIVLPRKVEGISRYHSRGDHKNLSKPYIVTKRAKPRKSRTRSKYNATYPNGQKAGRWWRD